MSKVIWVLDTCGGTSRFGFFQKDRLIDEITWESGRNLADTFYKKLDIVLDRNKLKYDDFEGIIINLGPGSFTSLRIGITIANTFSYLLDIPSNGVVDGEDMSLKEIYSRGIKGLAKKRILTPFYGKEPNITKKKSDR